MGRMHFSVDIANVNRCTGTMLGSVITRKHPNGLPDSSIEIECVNPPARALARSCPRASR